MMLVNGCVIIFIISFINSLFCSAEQLKEETTTVTSAPDDVTMESPKVTDKEELNNGTTTVKIATDNNNHDDGESVQKTSTEQLKEETTATTTIAPDHVTIELPEVTDKKQLNEVTTTVKLATDNINNDDGGVQKSKEKKSVALNAPKNNALNTQTTKRRDNRTKLLRKRPISDYVVTTADKYILKLHRLKSDGDVGDSKRHHSPVLLVPGLYQSSDRFILRRESQNLAYKLQDKGYDVWLFNARGNKYSRGHVDYDPFEDKIMYFKYTHFEIGYYDLAATIDFILEMTGLTKIHFIGHSLGGTFFLILTSLLPQYNDKIDRAYLMAPLSYHKHFPNVDLKKHLDDPHALFEDMKDSQICEVFPYDYQIDDQFVMERCLGFITYGDLCRELDLENLMDLKEYENTINDTRGGSIRVLVHLAQNIQSTKFRRFDFGKDNQQVYGEDIPPEYDISKITVRTQIIYSPTDEMVDESDIRELVMRMKNVTTRKVEARNFKHDDFIKGRRVMEDVYDGIISDLPIPTKVVRLSKTGKISSPKVREQSDGSSNLLPSLAILIFAPICHFLMHLRILL